MHVIKYLKIVQLQKICLGARTMRNMCMKSRKNCRKLGTNSQKVQKIRAKLGKNVIKFSLSFRNFMYEQKYYPQFTKTRRKYVQIYKKYS